MEIAGRYQSKSGNTEKVARAIAEAAGVRAQKVDVPLQEGVDLLFVGGAIYAGGLNRNFKNFLKGLQPGQVKNIAFFSTAMGPKGIHAKAAKLLSGGVANIYPGEFHAQSKELDATLPGVADFVKKVKDSI